MNERRLYWVQENRTRRKRLVPIGATLKEVLERPNVQKRSAIHQRLVSILDEHAGTELLEQVTIVGVRNGVLSFYVSEPAVLCQLRLQWEQKLLELLRTQLPGAGITEIRFTANMPNPG